MLHHIPALLMTTMILTACSAAPVRKSSAVDARAARTKALLTGVTMQFDAGFKYYQDRSPESIAAEFAANGYKVVHYCVTKDSAINGDIVKALHREGIKVWYQTFCHVAYDTSDFPPNWQSWRMKLRTPATDYNRMCMTNPEYREWKRAQVVDVMKKYPFDGCELVEPFWPSYPGPQEPTYGCLCDSCSKEFLRLHPDCDAIPEFTDQDSPMYYTKAPEHYRKWVNFRVRSIADFMEVVLNSPNGLRKARPDAPVMLWSLAQDVPNSVPALRESQGCDAADLAVNARPDAICFQSNWQDWTKPVLPPDYVLAYKPFVANLWKAVPGMPVAVQLDIGSSKDARRSDAWVRSATTASKQMGALGTVSYEYFIGKSRYDDPPKLVFTRPTAGGVTLVFQKRVDEGRSGDATNYIVTDAKGQVLKVTRARSDGNLIHLNISGLKAGKRYTVKAFEITDTPDRWLFPGYSAHKVANVKSTFTWKPAAKR